MHLGADRLLVIGLRHAEPTENVLAALRSRAKVVYPNAVFMLGKMLNALMLDKLEADLSRINRTNEMVEAGIKMYGDDFPDRIAEGMSGRRDRPYVPVRVLLIRPSQDLGELAYDVIRRGKLKRYKGIMAYWLRRVIGATEEVPESDLASYVLFDPEYVSQLIDLGFNDAAAHHAELAELFA